MPSPRGALGVTSLNEKIYAIGGGTNFIPRDNLEAYDPKTNSWIKLRPMPTPREHLAVATAGGLIFALGGYQKTRFNNLITNEAYD
ncbi:galactose oxidase, partial [Candidatus Roizmanbacteria bacterium]|nr:galactose oxidase [Candidatus Roizmanbacteria bacterium]